MGNAKILTLATKLLFESIAKVKTLLQKFKTLLNQINYIQQRRGLIEEADVC